ncbi:MAG: FkbM family methyltransferase [Gemmatimonadetes bacterium]|nr:FkbM family methyltransferase [Gemmatimonadota bacterium]
MSGSAHPLASRLLRAYHRGPEHPMKLRLYWAARKLQGYRRLTLPYAGTGWITVDERDVVGGHIFTQGAYEPEVWAALAAYARGDEVLWDVGANIGAVSVHGVNDARIGAVHAFEPDPGNAVILRHTLALNGGRSTIHPFALSDRAERRALHIAPTANRGLSSLATATSTGATHLVECRTVDELVFESGVEAPTLMKVDVEDWEAHVFRGARRLLAERPPRAIVFEAAADARGAIADADLRELFAGWRVTHVARGAELETRENYLAVPA